MDIEVELSPVVTVDELLELARILDVAGVSRLGISDVALFRDSGRFRFCAPPTPGTSASEVWSPTPTCGIRPSSRRLWLCFVTLSKAKGLTSQGGILRFAQNDRQGLRTRETRPSFRQAQDGRV